tara:strand:- start:140 stop:628 length:489 start_codon:yes stop_codon:yes gene_type:complete
MNKIIKNSSKIFFCTVVWLLCIVALYINKPAQSQPIMCNERTKVLESLKTTFNEELTEIGIGMNGIVVGITVSPKKTWTMVMIPKEKPYSYCVLITGSNWKQESTASTGLVQGGESLLSIGFDEDQNWTLIVVDYKTKHVFPVFTGYAWDRIKNINIQEQSL